jgi:hypothetical protein
MAKAKEPAAVTPPSVPVDSILDQLLEHLLYVRQQLLKIDPDSLNDDQHENWRTQVNAISLAITKVRNARLGQLNAAFATELPKLEAAADQLTDALYHLQAANEIIGAVAEGLGIVTQILTLLA